MALYKWNVKLAWIWVSNWIVTSATAPVSPIEWMVWYDTTNDQLKVYDWTNWNITGKEYVQGNWINISNNTVSVDTTVVATQTDLDSKQDTLVSGTNIKTINSTSLLGNWNIDVQDTLVSWTNIKTINGESVLGSWDLEIKWWWEQVGYIDFLMVWWGWAPSNIVWYWYYPWWWGAWGFVECFCQAIYSKQYQVTIWQWGTTYPQRWDWRWGDTIFYWIAYWGWNWGNYYNACLFQNWWSWWGWYSSWWNWGVGYSWQWCDWWKWNSAWWWGWWAWSAWCADWVWWAWKCSCMSWEMCWYAWWWGGSPSGSGTTQWWCWWWWNWGCPCWCPATYYGWWWGAWCSVSWNWYQWIVIIRYPKDWSYGFCDASWGCKYECGWYCIHCFTTDWCFTPIF